MSRKHIDIEGNDCKIIVLHIVVPRVATEFTIFYERDSGA